MSFFRWFSKKRSTPDSTPSLNSELGQDDATLPILRPQSPAQTPDRPADGSSRKSERLERRELLYAIVRECMTGAGVLSSAYKFKVLSLDAGGRKYLIMMDLPREQLVDPAHFAEIEGSIARGAKERYDIFVTAVYWRVNEMVTAVQRPQPHPASPMPQPDSSPVAAGPAPYAPLQAEEVMAFKRAVAAAASGVAAAKRGEVVRSGRRDQEHAQDFSNTEPFEAASPLGTSQFGGLG
jgi:hypothetical protein